MDRRPFQWGWGGGGWVGASNGSPALASSQSDGLVDLTTAEISNKEVDSTGAGVSPGLSAGPSHQTFLWANICWG